MVNGLNSIREMEHLCNKGVLLLKVTGAMLEEMAAIAGFLFI